MRKVFLLLLLFINIACSKDDDTNYDIQNDIDIEGYLTKNNLTAEKTITGLYYIIDNEGSGNFPAQDATVTVAYRGYLLNEVTFDQSANATFPLQAVIPGFSEAVQLLKPGGSGTFLLPSRLAYGNSGSGNISPGDVLIFDINLISID